LRFDANRTGYVSSPRPRKFGLRSYLSAVDPTSVSLSRDLTFVTNEPGNNLRDRLNTLLTKDTHFFDCLVGYFYISGFHKIYPALQNVEKVRILVGLQTDRAAYELWQHARRNGELNLSHKSTKEKVAEDVLEELEKAPDAQAIETR
jgi:hypothetical protein